MISQVKLYKGDNVVIYYSKKGKVLRHPTGIKVNPKHFDEKKYILKSSGIPNYKEYNAAIETIRQRVDTLILEYLASSREPDISGIKKQLKQSSQSPNSLIKYFDEYIESKSHLEKNSLKNLSSLKSLLLDYEKHKGVTYSVQDVDYDWIDGFVKFHQSDHQSDIYTTKGRLQNSSVNKYLKYLRDFWRLLENRELAEPNKYLSKYRLKNVVNDPIAISDSQLEAVVNYVPKNITEEKTKDIFILLCMTSMRYSDLLSLDSDDVYQDQEGDYWIKKIAQKTKNEFRSALNESALKILRKYDFNFTLPPQKFNVTIKTICKQLQEFQEVKKRKINIGKVEVKSFQLWELMTSKIGRKTFVTRNMEKNTPVSAVMEATGHRGPSIMTKYMQISNSDVQKNAAKGMDIQSNEERLQKQRQVEKGWDDLFNADSQ